MGVKITYITPLIDNGKVSDTSRIAISIPKNIRNFKIGERIKILNNPNYQGSFKIYKVHESDTNSGLLFVKADFVDTGEKGERGTPINRDAGTVVKAINHNLMVIGGFAVGGLLVGLIIRAIIK